MDIKLGFSSKRYTHRLNRDTNTTFPFGVTQPIFHQFMLPNSDISVSAKQLVRLAPLVVPSFARLGLNTVTRFVPMIDICPNFDALLSQHAFRSTGQNPSMYIPKTLPYTCSATLVMWALMHSNVTVYLSTGSDYKSKYTAVPTETDVNNDNIALSTLFKGGFKTFRSGVPKLTSDNYRVPALHGEDIYRPVVTVENADYIVATPKVGSTTTYYCFKFPNLIKNFRNICVGLGYSFDLDDYNKVSILPLFAYYKAWFDTYGLDRTYNWVDTPCFKLIHFASSNSLSFDLTGSSYNVFGSDTYDLDQFFLTLCFCYYSSPLDIASIHRDKLQNVTVNPLTYVDASTTQSVPGDVHQEDRFNDPSITEFPLSQVSLRALSALSRYINKSSIIGNSVSNWIRNKFGSSVVNQIFNETNVVDKSFMPLQINDVFSTSDTAQVVDGVKSGEHLGSYAGKGIGYGDFGFKYHSVCHGYIITLGSISADTGYYQGNDPTLFALDAYQLPCADFDALGMEITPRSAFIDHNAISVRESSPLSDITDSSFGYLPRYSMFKISKNCVNGDMSRRGTLDDMSPYYLDRQLTTNSLVTLKPNYWKFYHNPIPGSSYDWRFLARYPFLGNFDRIFVNERYIDNKGALSPLSVDSAQQNLLCTDDSYIGQFIFDVNVSNVLKPLSMSFDTFDEVTDNDSKDTPMA